MNSSDAFLVLLALGIIAYGVHVYRRRKAKRSTSAGTSGGQGPEGPQQPK